MDERDFFTQTETTKPATLNCPFCKQAAEYQLRWVVRKKRDRLPPRADEMDRRKFEKSQSYMVLRDDKVSCQNQRCRRSFDVSGIKTMAFL